MVFLFQPSKWWIGSTGHHTWLLTYVRLMLQLSSWAKWRSGWLPSGLVCLNICTWCTWGTLIQVNRWNITGPGQQLDQIPAISQRSWRLLCWALKDIRDYIKLFYVSCILGDTTLSNSLLIRDQLCSLQRPEGRQRPPFLSVHSYRNLSQQTTLIFTSDYWGWGQLQTSDTIGKS